MLKVSEFPGVTGMLSFNEEGEIQRDMQLLTLRGGDIAAIE